MGQLHVPTGHEYHLTEKVVIEVSNKTILQSNFLRFHDSDMELVRSVDLSPIKLIGGSVSVRKVGCPLANNPV